MVELTLVHPPTNAVLYVFCDPEKGRVEKCYTYRQDIRWVPSYYTPNPEESSWVAGDNPLFYYSTDSKRTLLAAVGGDWVVATDDEAQLEALLENMGEYRD